MAEALIVSNEYNEIANIIKTELAQLYESWYPLEHIVKETGSLEYTGIIQAGILYFESRDTTHFIASTERLYDLKTPMEYEHKVFVYKPATSTWANTYYGTETECRAHVIAWQSKHYDFDYSEYMRGKGKLSILEGKLKERVSKLTEDEEESLQELVELTTRSIRLKLDLANENDLPQLSLEEAVEESRRK